MRGRISRVVAPPRHGRGESNATQDEIVVAILEPGATPAPPAIERIERRLRPTAGPILMDVVFNTPTAYTATMYLLRYKRDGEWRVVIVDGYSIAHVRMVAAGLEPGRFVDGQPVSRVSVARLPPWAVGRVLTLKQLEAVARRKKSPRAGATSR
jgi:hypothetical protein